uniref:Homeobox domain-containing protein n=1 Tax=Panagrellus redivivus TaxID=6233 RepID=A0A7E4UQZ9_PANRE
MAVRRRPTTMTGPVSAPPPQPAATTSASSTTAAAKRVSLCTSCHQQITDPFILRVNPNLEFHASCLKCCNCDRVLNETCTAFVRNGRTFCRDDYLRLFGTRPKCCRCDTAFDRTEMVMRARNLVYHIGCFTCATCRTTLTPGERFLIHEDELYCRPECFATTSAVVQTPLPPPAATVKTEPAPVSNNLSDNSWNLDTSIDYKPSTSPLSSKSADISARSTPSSLCMAPPHHFSSLASLPGSASSQRHSASSTNSTASGKKSKKDKPSTRVRTVLSEYQLKILKTMYQQNTRPDAGTKDNLVEMTGLSARVIRVWFQNKRCKDKKRQTAMKEAQRTMEKEQALHGVRVNGIGPLVAEPSSTDAGLGLSAINIHQYPTNPSIWANGDCTSPTDMGVPQNGGYMLMNPYGELPPHPDYGYAPNGAYLPPPGVTSTNDYSSLSSPSCSD